MKKFLILAIVFCAIFLDSCGNEVLPTSNNTQIEEVFENTSNNDKDEIEKLRKQISELQLKLSEKEDSNNEKMDGKVIEDEKSAETTENENGKYNAIVSAISKKDIPKDIYNNIYSNRVEFTFNITNNYDKDIKGIQGIVDIQDMFGISILKFTCDFTQEIIKSNETITINNLGFDINQFKDSHTKIYTSNFDSLIFVYNFSQIIFTDGSIEKID